MVVEIIVRPIARRVLRVIESAEYASVIHPVAPVVEKANIPVRAQDLQEVEQSTRVLRELNGEHSLIEMPRCSPANHVADMFLRGIVAG